MNNTTGLEFKLKEMASRIKELREIAGLSLDKVAEMTGVSPDEYLACENGSGDFNFAFIYKCALAFNIDVTDIIEGASPKLRSYTVTRRDMGQRIEQAHGMVYYNMAAAFRDRVAEPLFVRCSYDQDAQNKDVELTSHAGQEFDIVIKGTLKVQIGEHIEILAEGDTIYYDSSTPHGMIAVNGQDCLFYAIVLDSAAEVTQQKPLEALPVQKPKDANGKQRIYKDFIIKTENDEGGIESIAFKNDGTFNFAFDVVDELAKRSPDRLAMLHVDKDKNERRFSFKDISRFSSKAANYFSSLGIKRGDRVMLVLKRHYQFWFSILGLHKIGAIAILAPNQLMAHDFEYRFSAADISAVIATADDNVPDQIEAALAGNPREITKVLVGAERTNWHNFDAELGMYSDEFKKPPSDKLACGDDLMLMFFTSGTTGYPKIAAHSFKYPLGHLITAKYWHCVNPEGLHLTISDTGWAKAMWGKLYGQWLCEAAIFVYDFDRFDANDILPLLAKYHVTTLCAPPTIYRMLIKEDLSRFDLSSVEHATTAGEALNPEVFRQFEKATGLKIMEGFGQSETTIILANLIGMPAKIGSMGKPVPLYDVDLLDSDGKPAGVGEIGEIVIRAKTSDGPNGLLRGYYGASDKTAESWHDGYYHTGDTAWRDEDGYYWYIGRVDDLIKSSGYRIGPFEVESVIMELPYVLECGVSAAPDEIRGQIVKASVVLTAGTEPTEELKRDLQEYVKKHTAPYKYPRIVVFCEQLPKTVSGKVRRSLL